MSELEIRNNKSKIIGFDISDSNSDIKLAKS